MCIGCVQAFLFLLLPFPRNPLIPPLASSPPDLERLSCALRHLPSLSDSHASLAVRALAWALLQFRSICQVGGACLHWCLLFLFALVVCFCCLPFRSFFFFCFSFSSFPPPSLSTNPNLPPLSIAPIAPITPPPKDDVSALLAKHPPHSTDDEGLPFWGPARRLPRPVAAFDPADPLHCDFVRWGAWLFARAFGHGHTSEAKVAAFSSDDLLSRALASLNSTSNSTSTSSRGSSGSNGSGATAESVLSQLRGLALPPELWRAEDFEKDDASLGHVAFVTAAANLRCAIYGCVPSLFSLSFALFSFDSHSRHC